MSDDKELIVPSGIPQFTGNVDTLASDAKTLASDAKLFRDSGASVHSTFQGLSACYKAPEADRLFATTAPVATKSSAFASDLEKVSGALSTYATEIRPLAKKLGDLKDEAVAFVQSVEGDDHWRRDKKKVEHNNNLWHSVNATVAAFHDAERACHDKIVALVGGERLVVDDGSHKPNMYGYKASDLDHAEQTPWGSMAEREYTGIAWLGHQVKSFVWDGFIVDGVWGTVKGLGTLVGTDGWDKAGEAWTGLGKLATGVVISCTPLSGAYWAARDDQLPGWLRDSRTAVKETGKALVAYDQWGKNPARAAGGVTFNVLTTVFTGGAGAAAKGGAVAKTVSVLGKAGRIVDPMTYVGKAGKFAFVKVGDAMSGLRNLRVGSTVHLAEETFKLPGQGAALPKRPAGLPESAAAFLGHDNKVVYLDKESGKLFNEHGKELQPPKKELSADQRAAEAAERQRQAQPQHSTVSEHERVPVAAGVHAGDDATASVGRGEAHGTHASAHGSGGHAPAANHQSPGSTPHHSPSGNDGNADTGGHSASHSSGAGADPHGTPHDPQSPASRPDGHGDQGAEGNPPDEHFLDPQEVAERIKELDDRQGGEGHAPGRHLHPDDEALKKRLGETVLDSNRRPKVYGPNSEYTGLLKSQNNIDPLTGTTVDGVTGRVHRVGAFSTRFNHPEDMVRADARFREYLQTHGTPPPDNALPISDLLGPEGHQRLTGFYRDPARPARFLPVDFENGSIKAIYRLDANNQWHLHTMYPNPMRGRHP